MKKTIILFSLLVLAIGAKAQGNLQFNQVVSLSQSFIGNVKVSSKEIDKTIVLKCL